MKKDSILNYYIFKPKVESDIPGFGIIGEDVECRLCYDEQGRLIYEGNRVKVEFANGNSYHVNANTLYLKRTGQDERR